MQYLTDSFAATYGTCAYGVSTYENGTCQTSTSGGSASGSSAGGLLTNTGFDLLLVATMACAIVFVSLVVRFWKRPAKPDQQA